MKYYILLKDCRGISSILIQDDKGNKILFDSKEEAIKSLGDNTIAKFRGYEIFEIKE